METWEGKRCKSPRQGLRKAELHVHPRQGIKNKDTKPKILVQRTGESMMRKQKVGLRQRPRCNMKIKSRNMTVECISFRCFAFFLDILHSPRNSIKICSLSPQDHCPVVIHSRTVVYRPPSLLKLRRRSTC